MFNNLLALIILLVMALIALPGFMALTHTKKTDCGSVKPPVSSTTFKQGLHHNSAGSSETRLSAPSDIREPSLFHNESPGNGLCEAAHTKIKKEVVDMEEKNQEEVMP